MLPPEWAQRTPDNLQVEYHHANLENLSSFDTGSFDYIVSCLVLQDVPDHQKAVLEMHRLLKNSGKFVLVITHPCFSSDGGWIKDHAGKRLYWKIDNYFFERDIEMAISPGADNNPIGFHRTLTTYFKTITGSGFTIEDLIEPFPSPEAIEKHPNFVNDLRMSHFLLFVLGKGQSA